LLFYQEAILAVTNTFEGRIFVDLSTASTVETSTYLANLFPEFRDVDIANATALYQNQGAPIDQAVAIMGECECSNLVDFSNSQFRG
jgi:acetylornithine/succinyldiaminopimelate/putrescine aminotransferase